MIYNMWAASSDEVIISKSELTKSQLINEVFNILIDVSKYDNDKLTIYTDKLTTDVTIITADNRHMTQAGQYFCNNKGLEYIIDTYDNQFSHYSLFVINTVNHIYIICPGSF